ncbi:TRI25 ligase, partial [Polypterus senegalus]
MATMTSKFVIFMQSKGLKGRGEDEKRVRGEDDREESQGDKGLTMAEAQMFVSQDEFICSVCLDTLTDPVTILCGHSFCLKCLTDCWDQSQECSCPQCRHTFITRPELNRNTLLNEVIKKLKKTTLSPPPQNYAGPGDVECDFCTGKKFRAVKSCLTCMASYCQTHLHLHYEGDALKHHKLVDPDRSLKEKLCEKHQKSLEIFCKTDDSCICLMCVVTGHKNHEMVELETEREEKQKQLWATLNDIKRGLEEREKTLKKTRRAMEEMKMFVERDMEENEKSFSALIRCIEEVHRKLTERIKEQEKRETEKAEGVIEQLKKEIEELKRREAELKELSETKDHLNFLQRRTCARQGMRYRGKVRGFTPSVGFIHRDLNVERFLRNISVRTHCLYMRPLKTTVKTTLGWLCVKSLNVLVLLSLTLDINMAHRDLHLSEGNKKVTWEGTWTRYPEHPERFERREQVLCREALTGTRCYWEVECSGHYMKIGVAYKGISRKGKNTSLIGCNKKSWCLQCLNSQYSVHHDNKWTEISAPYSPRIVIQKQTDTAAARDFHSSSVHNLRDCCSEKQLGATLSEIRRRLEDKEKKLRETRKTAEEMKLSVERVMREHEKSFTDLIHCIEEAHKKLTERIREQEKREMEKAEGVMEQLEKEIEELKRREAELKELSETKDHIHFLQVRATLHRESDHTGVYFCPLTLDINTAHRDLRLSEGNKKVTYEGQKPNILIILTDLTTGAKFCAERL